MIFLGCLVSAQPYDSLLARSPDFLKRLKSGDSVVYYQCHVESGIQQLSTASGQTLTGSSQKYTITEKYVLRMNEGVVEADYYTSSMTIFPNRKFSGLKIREKPYWDFAKQKHAALTERDLKILLIMEQRGREAMEYDYPITKYTTNQLIIRAKKNFKQLVIDSNYVLSKLIMK